VEKVKPNRIKINVFQVPVMAHETPGGVVKGIGTLKRYDHQDDHQSSDHTKPA